MTITIGAQLGVSVSNGIVIGPSVGVQLSGRVGTQFVGAYDDIPNVAALYGMRRLRSAYTGNILRLRRSSDNTESDFGYKINGDLDAAAIASWLGANSGYVTTWYDQSGNGNNATQSTAASQPLYVSPATGMAFDGSNDYLATNFIPDTDQSQSMAVKFSGVSGTTTRCVAGTWQAAARQFALAPVTGSTNVGYYNGQNVTVAPAASEGVLAVAGDKGYRNGVEDATGIGAWSGSILNALWIGGLNASGALSSPFAGNIQEMVVSATAYSGAQIAAITDIMEAA